LVIIEWILKFNFLLLIDRHQIPQHRASLEK
jgi:hypothetical protein